MLVAGLGVTAVSAPAAAATSNTWTATANNVQAPGYQTADRRSGCVTNSEPMTIVRTATTAARSIADQRCLRNLDRRGARAGFTG
jgi:hypothetical protein